jgi:hypothetical protein
VGEYEDHIKALAESGLSSEELSSRTQQLKQDFINQATALGYSRPEVQKYAVAFDDVTTAIARVPRNITVTANANPAIQALNEFEAKARSSATNASNAIRSGNGGGYKPRLDPVKIQFKMPSYSEFMRMQQYIRTVTGDPRFRIAIPGGQGGQVFAGGGYTGRGGKYQYAGDVHKGEYVVPQEGVDQRTGLPKPDYIGNLSRSASNAPSYAHGGYVSGRGMSDMVSLSPATIQQIANRVKPVLVVDGKMVNTVVQRGFENNYQFGNG